MLCTKVRLSLLSLDFHFKPFLLSYTIQLSLPTYLLLTFKMSCSFLQTSLQSSWPPQFPFLVVCGQTAPFIALSCFPSTGIFHSVPPFQYLFQQHVSASWAFLSLHHSSPWEHIHWCLPPRTGKNTFSVILPCQWNLGAVCVCMCLRFKGTFIIKFHFLCRQTLLPAGWQTRGNERANKCVRARVGVGVCRQHGAGIRMHCLLFSFICICLFSPPTAKEKGVEDNIRIECFS